VATHEPHSNLFSHGVAFDATIDLLMSAFLRHCDLFPDAPTAHSSHADPESGVQRVARRRPHEVLMPAEDLHRVPVLLVALDQVRACTSDPRARWLAPFIDGVTPLERVLADCALCEDDARAALELLIDDALVAML
jgi:hypothetical protein